MCLHQQSLVYLQAGLMLIKCSSNHRWPKLHELRSIRPWIIMLSALLKKKKINNNDDIIIYNIYLIYNYINNKNLLLSQQSIAQSKQRVQQHTRKQQKIIKTARRRRRSLICQYKCCTTKLHLLDGVYSEKHLQRKLEQTWGEHAKFPHLCPEIEPWTA